MKALRAFILAAISVLTALLLTLLITPLHQEFKFLLFVFAVVISATRGIWPGVFATLLSAVLALCFLFQPVRSMATSDWEDMVGLILFCSVGIVITLITRRLQHSEETMLAAGALV